MKIELSIYIDFSATGRTEGGPNKESGDPIKSKVIIICKKKGTRY